MIILFTCHSPSHLNFNFFPCFQSMFSRKSVGEGSCKHSAYGSLTENSSDVLCAHHPWQTSQQQQAEERESKGVHLREKLYNSRSVSARSNLILLASIIYNDSLTVFEK